MDGLIQLSSDDLKTADGVSKLNNMFKILFNNAPGDGNTIQDLTGYGSPETVVTAGIGSTYRQIDGAAGTTLYVKQSGSGNTGWVAIPSLPLSSANGGTGNIAGFPYIKVTNTQSQNVSGGSTTSGSWQTAIINTKDNDTSSLGTLSGNALTLPAGTYVVNVSMPIYAAQDRFQIRLYNNTDSVVLINGTSVECLTNQEDSFIRGQFTLSSSKALIVQYQVTTSQSPNGQGVVGNFGTEVYLTAEFFKVG